MKTQELAKILQDAYLAKLPVLLFGSSGVGKSSFCQDLFVQAEVLLEAHLDRIFSEDQKIFIIENISEASFNNVYTYIRNGAQRQNFLIFTSRQQFSCDSHVLKLEFEFDKTLWLAWAKKQKLHSNILALVQDDKLHSLTPKDWENISHVLKHFNHKDHMASYLKGFLLDQVLIDSILDFDITSQIKSNEHFKQDLESKVLLALESIDNENSKENLRFYLSKEAFFEKLNEVLANPVIKQKLDLLIGK